MAKRLQESAARSQGEQQTRASRFHRLGLVRLVHEIKQGSFFATAVQGLREQGSRAFGSGLPAPENAERRNQEAKSRARAAISSRRISNPRRAQWRRAEALAARRLFRRRAGRFYCAVGKTAQRLSAAFYRRFASRSAMLDRQSHARCVAQRATATSSRS